MSINFTEFLFLDISQFFFWKSNFNVYAKILKKKFREIYLVFDFTKFHEFFWNIIYIISLGQYRESRTAKQEEKEALEILSKIKDDEVDMENVRPTRSDSENEFEEMGKIHYVWFSWFWSHLKMSKNVLWVIARLPQRLKSMLFEKISHSAGLFKAALPWNKFHETLILATILAFEANGARENETKIVKITHSVCLSKIGPAHAPHHYSFQFHEKN